MIFPQRLTAGDTIAIVAPAGPPDPAKMKEGLELFKHTGLHVKLGKYVFNRRGFLAASDQERVRDLHDAFVDPEVKGIVCARGGYGTARIAPCLDYALIRAHPKVFWGYSDLTYLNGAIQLFSGLVTFHGPMIASDLSSIGGEESLRSFFQLFVPTELCFSSELSVVNHGRAEGKLVGGNLTLLADAVGTPYQWDFHRSILFIEEVSEPAYRIDAMLHHLKYAGVFDEVCGVVLGDFNVEEKELPVVKRVVREFFEGCSFPVVCGLPAGHCEPNYGIPLGTRAALTTAPACLRIDPGVC
ncbi:LD-carboxypeptidase [Halobacillus litoralis]|uniref:S66 peptidase family protein n=1 Tax=Halobacillus litoralis TaxID=45668 RepID=UPI001CD64092|nr:LD-carboxypeptidase [Halobacillus litoralis]MCA0969179.1 LD-carboxypeptidase [Halobacillus litoralis]